MVPLRQGLQLWCIPTDSLETSCKSSVQHTVRSTLGLVLLSNGGGGGGGGGAGGGVSRGSGTNGR